MHPQIPARYTMGAPKAGTVGVVTSATFPIERILSTPMTGFGNPTAAEFVVLGSKEPSVGRVDSLLGVG